MRLALGCAAAMAVVVAVVAALVYVSVRDQLRDQIDDQLRDRYAVIAQPAATARLSEGDFGEAVRLPAPPAGRAKGLIQFVTPSGEVRTLDQQALPVGPQTTRVAAGEARQFLADATVGASHVRVLTAPLPNAGAVQIALPLDEVDALLGRLRWAIGLVGLAGIAMAGGLAALVARAGLAPVRRLDTTAERVAHTGDLTRRIDVTGNDEVARLATTFNEMLAALERSQVEQRRLVSDASHELRTPLTALRTNIEVLSDSQEPNDGQNAALMADIRSQLKDLSGLVGDLVELARGAEEPGNFEDVGLDALVESAIRRAARDAPSLRFTFDGDGSIVRGEPGQLARAIANLLDNAAKWSPPNGEITVTVREGELTVRDRGPGIPEADLPHVFDRFYRSSTARRTPGSGLGLAIVRQAAQAHGGGVVAELAPGGGTLMRLRLPLAATGVRGPSSAPLIGVPPVRARRPE